MPNVHELVAQPGAAESLRELADSSESAFDRTDLEDQLFANGVTTPTETVDEFLAAQLLERFGTRIGISSFGQRAALLVEALNGGDVEDVYRRLRRLSHADELYELVREGMTGVFLESLVDRPGFGRLYVCSPWINPSKREAAYLKHGFMLAERAQGAAPEVLVISRPPSNAPAGTEEGLQPFRDIGSQLFFHRRVHTKLYVREPNQHGGYTMAIIGSQNLTRSNNFELGIKIANDTGLIDQLIRYFFDLMNVSEEQDDGGE